MPGKGQKILVLSFPMQALFLSCLSLFHLTLRNLKKGLGKTSAKSSFVRMCFYIRVILQVVVGLGLVSST